MSVELVRALVMPKHVAQYQTDADFHATVEQLAALLPFWIDALAVECANRAVGRAAAIEQLRNSSRRSPITPEGR